VFQAPADAKALEVYRDVGIQRVLLEVKDLGRDEALRAVDQLAPLAQAFVA
jgi:hypothetical protein